MATILLADDHPMVLRGLHTVLQEEPDFVLVGEAVTGAQTLDLVAQLHPDILILDIMLPDMNGIDLLGKLDARRISTRVVIFSMHANDSYVRAVLQAGAAGFVLKDALTSELIHAIHQALLGHRYLSSEITDRAVDLYLQHDEPQIATPIEAITARERQILQLVALGETSIAIADQLIISPRTVETHRANLMRKLALKSQADLLRYAVTHNIPTQLNRL